MKKGSLIFTFCVSLSILFGCSSAKTQPSDAPSDTTMPLDDYYESSEFVYVAHTALFPIEITEISSVAYSQDRLFFVSKSSFFNESTYEYTNLSEIYSISLDGSDCNQLPNYRPIVASPSNAAGGALSVDIISSDSDGCIWVVEQWHYTGYELPDDFDTENDRIQDYPMSILDSGTAIRKLDSTGAEQLSLDVNNIMGNSDNNEVFLYAAGVDSYANIYISTADWERGGAMLHVFDTYGNQQFDLEIDANTSQFIRMPDGFIGFETYIPSEDIRILQVIDYEAQDFGGRIVLPQNGTFYSGNGEYDLLISNERGIYGFVVEANKTAKTIDWFDSGIYGSGIANVTAIPDGRIVCTNQGSYSINMELLVFTKTLVSDLPPKSVLTLATFDVYNIRDLVVSFNRFSSDYRIVVIDYSEFSVLGDLSAGYDRFRIDMSSGKIPDILDLSGLPYKEYAARGLLADLYPLVDSDPDFNRGDFMDGAFRAAEINGNLYQIFPSFSVNTLTGHPDVVGGDMGWNMSEFARVIDNNPQADIPLGEGLTKMSFLQTAVSVGIDEYIDWEAGDVHFDTTDFIQLMEFANTLPTIEEYEGNFPGSRDSDWDDHIVSGRQIMEQMTLYSFGDYQWKKAQFGGELVFKGFPAENRVGNSLSINTALAITAGSSNKEGAWSFLRMILDKDWQIDTTWDFPTNKAAFEERARQAMVNGEGQNDDGLDASIGLPTSKPLTQADVDKIAGLISSTSGTAGWGIGDPSIENIIREGVMDYFSGQRSAEDVARIIQNRVSTLVAERR